MFGGLDTSYVTDVPSPASCLAYIRALGKHSCAEVLKAAHHTRRPAIQPRCGVGSHDEMLALLRGIEKNAAPELLTLTIDSHTRLLRFEEAERILDGDPARLNGYPLVAHGWRRGRAINEAVHAPIQIRHGSPDPRDLFVTAIASGITSFEGGGVSYNLPYAKKVDLGHSLRAWQQVDRACGALAAEGIVVERELFGTLTAVLMPPSISLAVVLLEAVAAVREGVACLSLAYPQGGNAVQDVAALRALGTLAKRYLGVGVAAYPVLHQFMGAFPRDPARAKALIIFGGLVAVWGGAAKVVVKTEREALGIPDLDANVQGLRLTRAATSGYLGDSFGVDEEAVEREAGWICREVEELIDPVLGHTNVIAAIEDAFRAGRLDVPFSASMHAHNAVLPCRDSSGAIRFARTARLPFSPSTLAHNERLLGQRPKNAVEIITDIQADIEYFSAPFPARLRQQPTTDSAEEASLIIAAPPGQTAN